MKSLFAIIMAAFTATAFAADAKKDEKKTAPVAAATAPAAATPAPAAAPAAPAAKKEEKKVEAKK